VIVKSSQVPVYTVPGWEGPVLVNVIVPSRWGTAVYANTSEVCPSAVTKVRFPGHGREHGEGDHR